MATVNDIVDNILKFTDQDFFQLDAATIGTREADLLDLDVIGVAVNAPKTINIDQQEHLPLLLAIRCDGERDWDFPLPDNCVLVGMNLTDGTIRFANGLMNAKDIESRGGRAPRSQPPKPPHEELEGEGVQISLIDARRQLKIKWETGIWSLAILHYDWPSNTVIVHLSDAQPSTQTATLLAINPPPASDSANSLPSYICQAISPPMPTTGAEFRLEPWGGSGATHQMAIYGAFHFQFKNLYSPPANNQHAWPDGITHTVAAVIPITLAVLAPHWEVPDFITWAVPVYGTPLKPGDGGQGYLAIDISAFTAGMDAGDYVAYLFVDGQVYGPQTLHIQ